MGWLYDAMDRPGRRLYNTLRGVDSEPESAADDALRTAATPATDRQHALPAGRDYRPDAPRRPTRLSAGHDHNRLRKRTVLWAQEPTERYYTATADGKAYLTTWGCGARAGPGYRHSGAGRVRGRRPSAGGPSTLPARSRSAGGAAARAGGFGVGPTADLLRELIAMPAEAQIVAIAGRNEKLRLRLERLAAGAARPVRVVGFTDQMHDWMHAADVVVTKPGGVNGRRVAGLRGAAGDYESDSRAGDAQQRLSARTWRRDQGQQPASAGLSRGSAAGG